MGGGGRGEIGERGGAGVGAGGGGLRWWWWWWEEEKSQEGRCSTFEVSELTRRKGGEGVAGVES